MEKRKIDLKAHRKRLGLSQRDLAAAAGLKPGDIWNIENGYSDALSMSKKIKVAEALRLPLFGLFPELVEKIQQILRDNKGDLAGAPAAPAAKAEGEDDRQA